MKEYQRDIQEIVEYTLPGSEFEDAGINEVADRHGDDPANVRRDVNLVRGLLVGTGVLVDI